MKLNEHTAIETSSVLLVPYDTRHVPIYHEWMEDEAMRVATASDRLTLDEEYANQIEWRTAPDKLTFIVCQPPSTPKEDGIVAGVDDAPGRMVGDINFFLYPWDDEDDDSGSGTSGGTGGTSSSEGRQTYGEIDVMIARPENRGRGLGRAAVSAFLHYILRRQQTAIVGDARHLRHLVVKIQATNAASIGLFTSLGFRQRGGVNYFGEVELVHDGLDSVGEQPDGYAERTYIR